MEIKLETKREMGFNKSCKETAKLEASGDKKEIKKLLTQALELVKEKEAEDAK